jgi:hypothetical protein
VWDIKPLLPDRTYLNMIGVHPACVLKMLVFCNYVTTDPLNRDIFML